MPELRKDPIIGRWVIIATERAKRPNDFKSIKEKSPEDVFCPFCEGREENTPEEITALRAQGSKPNAAGWDVRVVPSINPLLSNGSELIKRPHGIYDMMNGVGAHEIIIETPQHIRSMHQLDTAQIAKVLKIYQERIIEHSKDKRLKYTIVFKNHKPAAGSSNLTHCRSKLIALPVCPKSLKGELEGAKQYFNYRDRCVYCDIISQETRGRERVIFENKDFIAIAPFASRFPFETWVLPKEHSCDYSRIKDNQREELAAALKDILARMDILLDDPPYNYVLHTSPYRRPKSGYWSTIEDDYHWHIEIIPRLTKVAGFEWGTGFYINPTKPEAAAKFLREVKEQAEVKS